MNKIFTSILASLLLVACSSDDKVAVDEQPVDGLQFVITAKNQSDEGLKAGTPIYSQQATQHVTRVNIHAFKSNGTDYLYVKTYSVSGWLDGTTSKIYTVDAADKLPGGAGDYKFLVVGQGAADDYTITTPSTTTKFEEVAASIAAAGNESEIFAGSAQATVTDKGARVSVDITRKVAGVLGYFKNIPQVLDGQTVRYLRLTVSKTNLNVNLSTGLGSVAGATGYNIINLDLSTQPVVNGVYSGNTISGVVKVANSQLWGAYLLPATGVSFTLGLYDTAGTAIKTWVVKNGTNTTFDILANNFYSLGTKGRPDTTTGEDPDPANPGDDDNPIDLLTDQTITITISPAWATINNLVIE